MYRMKCKTCDFETIVLAETTALEVEARHETEWDHECEITEVSDIAFDSHELNTLLDWGECVEEHSDFDKYLYNKIKERLKEIEVEM